MPFCTKKHISVPFDIIVQKPVTDYQWSLQASEITEIKAQAERQTKVLKPTLMESFPSSTMQMSRSLCLKPKPFLEDPKSCSRAPVHPKTPDCKHQLCPHADARSEWWFPLARFALCNAVTLHNDGLQAHRQTVSWRRPPGPAGCALWRSLPARQGQSQLENKKNKNNHSVYYVGPGGNQGNSSNMEAI